MPTYDTGHGASFATSSSTLNGRPRAIRTSNSGIQKVSSEALDTTDFMTYKPGDLAEPEEITFPFLFDSEGVYPAKGAAETGTLTWPLASGQTTAATYAGSGFIMDVKLPDFEINTIQEGELTFAFDGETGPTFTAAT